MGRIPIPLPGQNRQATPFDLAIGRGDQALRRGQYSEAMLQFQQARTLNATDARPSFYIGETLIRQGQYAQAEAHLRNAIRLNPRMAEAHADLGTVLRELHRSAEAVAEFQAALQLDPTLSEAHAGMAMSLEDAGQTDRAIAEYRRAVALAPTSPMPALNLGILLANTHPAAGTQARAEAFRMLQAAVRNANNDRAVLANAGPALRAVGEHALAAQVLERARAAGTPTAALLGELAQALWASGNRPVALQRIAEAVALDAANGGLHYVRGLMLADQGQLAEATAEMRRVVQAGGDAALVERARQRLADLQRASAQAAPRRH